MHGKKIINEGGMRAWSDQFLLDRFANDALDPSELAWFRACQEQWKPGSVLGAIRCLVGADLRDGLHQIQCPALLLHGDSSPFIPVAVMADLHARLANSSFQVYRNAKHGLPFSHGEQCSRELRRFLDRQQAKNDCSAS